MADDRKWDPLEILKDSIKYVPEVKYAYAVVGVVSASVIIKIISGHADILQMVPAFLSIVFCMAVIFIFVLATRSSENSSIIGQIFLGSVCLLVIFLMFASASAITFGYPKQLAILLQRGGASELSAVGAIQATIANGTEGYVYYEASSSGAMTDDGRLSPINSDRLVPLDKIKIGDILKAADGVKVHQSVPANVSGITPHNTPIVTVMISGQCAKVRGGVIYPVKISRDGSGGWIPVVLQNCSI